MVSNLALIRHKKFLDTAIRVLRVESDGQVYKILGSWVNLGFNHSFHIGDYIEMNLSFEDLSDWQQCFDHTIDGVAPRHYARYPMSYRHSRWHPLRS